MKVICAPGLTGSRDPDFVIETSATPGGMAFTGVVAVAVLLAGLLSVSLSVTVAVFVNVVETAAAVGMTTIDIVACAPFSRLPKTQVIVVVPLQKP